MFICSLDKRVGHKLYAFMNIYMHVNDNMIICAGLEATTYELMISVGNAASTVSAILATQLLWTFKANGCKDEPCSPDSVDITSEEAFDDSDGPARFSKYEILICKWHCGYLTCQ
jgi:hypothetical protein